jgi:uncharacterized membrane-anchored protein
MTFALFFVKITPFVEVNHWSRGACCARFVTSYSQKKYLKMKKHLATNRLPVHPPWLWVLKTLLLLLGICALISGSMLMLDPSGKSIQFPAGYLDGSPFSSYFIPGLLLSVFIGLLSLSAWVSLWKTPKIALFERLNPFQGRHWAWTLALMSGISLVIWILVQMLMVPYFFLQPTLLLWGLMIVMLCFAPGVRAFYTHRG